MSKANRKNLSVFKNFYKSIKENVINNKNMKTLMSVLTINFAVLGLVFLIWGKNIEKKLSKIETLSDLQTLGFFLVIFGLICYCIYLISELKEKERVFLLFLIISAITLCLQIIIIIIGFKLKNSMDYKLFYNSLGILSLINIVIVFALLEYLFVSFISKAFSKTFDFFEKPNEKISVILGFFGTIIALIIKILN